MQVSIQWEPLYINFSSDLLISQIITFPVIISNFHVPEPEIETGMAVQSSIAMIKEENLNVSDV